MDISIIRKYKNILGYKSLLYFIKRKLTSELTLFEINRKDYKYPFYIRVPSSDIFTYQQIFIDEEYKFNIKQEPKVIIDAGANIGLASIYFANRYKNSKIIAIEPEESNFHLLKKNIAPYHNIVPLQAALWHKDEMINVIDIGLGKWGFITGTEEEYLKQMPSSKICHTVLGITVDTIIKDYNLSSIDILKIDIEGAEKEVFSSTSTWIDKVNILIVELHERIKPGCNRIFYKNTDGFDNEWIQGENIYLSKKEWL